MLLFKVHLKPLKFSLKTDDLFRQWRNWVLEGICTWCMHGLVLVFEGIPLLHKHWFVCSYCCSCFFLKRSFVLWFVPVFSFYQRGIEESLNFRQGWVVVCPCWPRRCVKNSTHSGVISSCSFSHGWAKALQTGGWSERELYMKEWKSNRQGVDWERSKTNKKNSRQISDWKRKDEGAMELSGKQHVKTNEKEYAM